MYILFACALIFAASLASVQAAPIVYSFTGTGSGAYNAAEFNEAFFEIILTGDSDNVVEDTDPTSLFFGQFTNPGLTGTLSATGTDLTLPVTPFFDPITIYLDPLLEVLGIFDPAENTLLEFFFAGIGDYDLRSSFGPISTDGATYFSDMVIGDGDVFAFESITDGTFTADGGTPAGTIPEPGTLVFLGSGLVGLVFLKLRKK